MQCLWLKQDALDEILDQFPYFECLHHLYASRPNVVPICITTGVTQRGPHTIWHQSPDNTNIDPALLAPPAPPTPPCTFSSNISNMPATPNTGTHVPSTPTPSALSRTPSLTKTSTPMVPQKRTLLESMLEMSQ